jgi:hypothetical protein
LDPQTVIERLKEAVEKDRLVVVVGAGPSMEAPTHLPSWHEFVEKMCTFAQQFAVERAALMRAELQAGDLLAAADPFADHDRIPRSERARFFRQLFDSARPPPEIYKTIASLPARHWITTNFDNNLRHAVESRVQESVAAGVKYEVEVVSNNTLRPVLSLWNEKHFAVYINGRAMDYDSIVYSTPTYQRLQAQNDYRALLRRMFLESTCLFYGFSLTDPGFRETIRYVGRELGGASVGTHFAIAAGDRDDDEDLRKANVVLVHCNDAHGARGALIQIGAALPPKASRPPTLIARSQRDDFRDLVSVFMSVADPARQTTFQNAAGAVIVSIAREAPEPQSAVVYRLSERVHAPYETANRMFLAAKGYLIDKKLLIEEADNKFRRGAAPKASGVSIDKVVSAVDARARSYRSGVKSSSHVKQAIRDVIAYVMLGQGMTLARAFANQDQPEAYALIPLIDDALREAVPDEPQLVDPLRTSVLEVLSHPDAECSVVLFQLAHAAYAMESVFLNPLGVDLGRALSWRIYLDSNVGLRLLAPGDPQHRPLEELVRQCERVGAPLFMLFPFLEEMAGQVEVVRRTVQELGIKTLANLRNYAADLRPENRSPILNWYVAATASKFEAFDDFSRRVGINSIPRIQKALEGLGIKIDGRNATRDLDTSTRETLWDALRQWRGGEKTLSGRRLRRNEATQIEWLVRLRDAGTRSWFLSVDGRLRQALTFIFDGRYAGFVMTPTAWAHRMAELHWGELEMAGFTEMMWSLPEPTTSQRLEHAVLRRVLEDNPRARELDAEELRDRVERLFVGQTYVDGLDAIENPVDQARAFEDVLKQIMPKAVAEILDEMGAEKRRH